MREGEQVNSATSPRPKHGEKTLHTNICVELPYHKIDHFVNPEGTANTDAKRVCAISPTSFLPAHAPA